MKYVDEFEFPSEAGFTGSVQKFAKGGRVGHKPMKQSSQFKMKTTAQDSMDHGVQPAREGRNEAEIEAGGTPRLLPGFKKGGRVKKYGGKMTADEASKQAPPFLKKGGGGKVKMGGGGKTKNPHGAMYKQGGKMGFKKGAQHKYAAGGKVGARNTVTGANPSEGEAVPPVGRGAKNVGKGGKVGKHKGFKYAKGGKVGARNTVSGTNPSEGEHVPAVGRGAKMVGKGGKTGKHKGFRVRK